MAVARPKRPEDPVLFLLRNARPTVVDRDPNRPVDLVESEADVPAVGRPAKRVREQVRDHLQYPVAVRLEDGRGRDRTAVVDPTAARLLTEGRVRTVDEPLQVDLLSQEGKPVRVELREVEDVANEPFEPLGLEPDHLER